MIIDWYFTFATKIIVNIFSTTDTIKVYCPKRTNF